MRIWKKKSIEREKGTEKDKGRPTREDPKKEKQKTKNKSEKNTETKDYITGACITLPNHHVGDSYV